MTRKLSIKSIKEGYNTRQANGNIYGLRSLTGLSHEDLYRAAALLTKQSNRQVHNMLTKYDLRSPSVMSFLKKNGDKEAIASAYDGESLYQAGRIRLSNKMTDSQLQDVIVTNMQFFDEKTHTKKGAEEHMKRVEASLKETTGLDLSNESTDDKRAFWEKIEKLKSLRGDMAARWADTSSEVLTSINEVMSNDNMSLIDALNRINDEIEKLGVDEGDRAIIQDQVSAGQAIGSSTDFEKIQKNKNVVE